MTLSGATAYAGDSMRVVSWVWASWRSLARACGLLVVLSSGDASAQPSALRDARAPVPVQELRVDEERLRLMHETIGYTDVLDARDGQDRFDLNVNLEYARLFDRATVYRERELAGGTRGAAKLADSVRQTSQLTLGIDVGLLRDVMVFGRMPLVLSESRELRRADGVSAAQAQATLRDPQGGSGAPLFALPFSAPTRAGLDYLALGAAWALTNQMRRSAQPSWVLRFEGRRAVGRTLLACRPSDTGNQCGSQSPEDRDHDGRPDGTRVTRNKPGSSRGVSALLVETRFSRRFLRAEPYAGLSLLVEWAALGSDAREAFVPAGYGRARPGPQTAVTLGVALIPWEDRGRFQRILLDLRLAASHVARGTDYSALFDALGSSNDASLAAARSGVSFHGLTEIEAHLRYAGQVSVEIQAARYVRFALGSWLQWATEHAITGRDACDGPSATPAPAAAAGRVCSDGKADARERGVIDAPGRRFLLRDQLLLGIYAQATASF